MKPKPTTNSRRASYAPAALPQAERLTPATAALLEKLTGLRAAQQAFEDAGNGANHADNNLTVATKLRGDAFEKRSRARRVMNEAETALAAQLATMPLTPIRHNGETFVHVPGAGMQSFKCEPLALGVQS